jgi:hypothetical protein
VSLSWQHKEPVGPQYHNGTSDQREIRQHAGFLFTKPATNDTKIIKRFLGELSTVLDVVAVEEHREDQGGEDEAHPEGTAIAPDLGTSAQEQSVHKGQNGVQADQPGWRLPWTLNMARVDTMNPAGVEVEEVEDDIADVRNGEHLEIARHV